MFWQRIWDAVSETLLAPERLLGLAGKLVQILLIAGIAWLAAWLVGKLVRRVFTSRARFARKPGAQTVFTMLRSMVYYVFFFIALIMVLRVVGVDFSAILAGAGVVGLAIGFGAQTMVRDFLSGFFLLFEDSVNVGDFITMGDISGTVEFVGIRRTLVRAFDGTLYTIPNGELTKFGNKNRDYMQAVVNVDLAYEQDAERGLALAQEAADAWYKERQDIALQRPEVQGVLAFGESGMTIRVVARVRPLKHWEAERELRNRLKRGFDSQDVEIPFARRVVYLKTDGASGQVRSPKD
ncbi:MAG: mechanosensitive ion channel family protein [candidate division WOR-3 bacterium]|nr:MAG: mechanosensitive ion channel family protein [candidate division WOR-3 bacterium]